MKLPLYQVDAFAESVFKGNPAAVIPLAEWIDVALMQQIAMENNLSETVFFVKNEDAQFGLEGSYHIRWFTPEYEIDLCGHATLASAYVIKNFLEPHVQDIHFTTEKAGPLKASAKDGLYTLDFPARMPEDCDVPTNLLPSLGLSAAVEIRRSRDYFVVLPDEDAVLAVEPDYTLMKELDTIGVIVTAKGREADIVSRCFYPGAGIPEDPVTGSAHCNIVPFWAQKLGTTKLHCRQLSPRGGDLWCSLDGDRVLMSGKCALFLQGEISL
ncbi:PhzF family phenazine biosynthesis protein [Flaviaesturariibacter aridisoli]|uniref:PhzF family phenazine biosynthesis protein n=1 Tax=Flaviaesturariibacter aridisoli TaxID=2545761 RepID=A0A4R4E0I2_9BACT|nr:PhzF family phenazine biosynthesis protein [Flaviaesturariibacter aridisoli]TCZ72924.1 PhzF family phenazine biosynthesis protein [Flaviaesturariibacter aridisoli]